jgi:outer membrane murein-binding lipoprotein Lpp
MKALLVEVAKMQDRHVDGLKQAVDVIAGTAETVDGLMGLMRTMVAHQQQLESDQSAMAQQLAAWARTTQIP